MTGDSSLALEHPGSPIPSRIERATKKVLNKDLNASFSGDMIMEDPDQGKDSFNEILMANVGSNGEFQIQF